MLILVRHILREHVAPFLYALFVITALFLVDFVVQIMDSILSKGLDWHVVIELFLLNTAWMLALSIPMSVLVASLMAFGRMSADREIDAMRSAGVSPLRMILPPLLVSFLVAGGLVWFNNRVLPEANFRAASLREDISRKKPAVLLEPRSMIQEFEGFRIWIQSIDQGTDSLRGILIHQIDRNGGPPTVITAKSGVVRLTDHDRTWKFTLRVGETHTPDRSEPRHYARVRFQELLVDVPNIDSRLHRSDKSYRSDRELPIEEMRQRVAAANHRESLLVAENGERIFTDLRFVTNLLELDSASAHGSTAADSAQRKADSVSASDSAKRLAAATRKRVAFIRDANKRRSRIFETTRANAEGDLVAAPPWRQPLDEAGPNLDLADFAASRGRDAKFALEQVTSERNEANRYLVEIHKKFSIPAACIVFVLVGAPLGVMARAGGIGTGVAYSIAFFILYWAGLIGGESLADRGIVPPTVAMWGPNAILGLLGLWLVSFMGREVQFFRYAWLVALLKRLRLRKEDA